MSKDRGVYLMCLYDCIQRVRQYTHAGKEEYFSDTKTQDAVMRNIEIIGQAVKDFGIEELTTRVPEIPWKSIAGMRDLLAHRYLGVDIELTWEVVEHHLIPLQNAVERVADALAIHPEQRFQIQAKVSAKRQSPSAAGHLQSTLG
jgi:uncharacterized protein with HEPN domain